MLTMLYKRYLLGKRVDVFIKKSRFSTYKSSVVDTELHLNFLFLKQNIHASLLVVRHTHIHKSPSARQFVPAERDETTPCAVKFQPRVLQTQLQISRNTNTILTLYKQKTTLTQVN